MLGGFCDLPADDGIVGAKFALAELNAPALSLRAQVEDCDERHAVAVDAARKEVVEAASLAGGQALELSDGCLAIERHIEGCEAVGWVPASPADARAAARERVSADGEMPIGLRLDADRLERVDPGDEPWVEHVLDENAFSHRVDRSQHATEFAGPKQLDRLVVIERRIGRE